MERKKQNLVMRLMGRGPYKYRPDLLAAALTTPIYENYRNRGETIREAIKSARKVARMVSRFGQNYEVAAKEYREALDFLGSKQFSRFVKSEIETVFNPSSSAGIRMRAWAYAPVAGQIGEYEDRFEVSQDRSEKVLGKDYFDLLVGKMEETGEDFGDNFDEGGSK